MIDTHDDWTIHQLAEFLAQHLHCTAAEAEASICSFLKSRTEKLSAYPVLSPPDEARTAAIVETARAEVRRNDGIPTYLENHILDIARRRARDRSSIDFLMRYERRFQWANRFQTWKERQDFLSCLQDERIAGSELDPRQLLYSQGAGEVFRWRGVQCFKTVFDLGIFALLIDELKPKTIIELGAGCGGSAMLMADLSTVAGVMTRIHAVDLKAPQAEAHAAVIFHEADCIDWLRANCDKDFPGPRLIIEDFHGALDDAGPMMTRMLRTGDYLVIEDSIPKQDALRALASSGDYLVDTRLTDFFGINCSSAVNGILVRN